MSATDRLGTITREDGHIVLRIDRRLSHPREKVWRALTESAHLAAWFPADIVGPRRAGATLELPFWPDHVDRYGIEAVTLGGSIAVWDPPAVFEWWWDTDRLRFELEPHGSGTHLRFTTWIVEGGEADVPSAAGTAAGYHVCFDHLRMLLDTGSAPPLVDAETDDLEARYRAVLDDAHHDR